MAVDGRADVDELGAATSRTAFGEDEFRAKLDWALERIR